MNIGLIIFGIITSIFVFAGVFLPIYSIFRYPVPDEPPVHRQIAKAVGMDHDTIFENPIFAPILNLCAQLAKRLNITSLREKVRQDLSASGNPSGYTVDQYIALAIFSALLAAAVGLILEFASTGGRYVLLTIPMMMAIGFQMPILVLSAAARKRVAKIGKQLPYTLDLVSLVMTAGSSFTEAIETLIRDNPEDELNQELHFALSEMEFGSTRAVALQNMGNRIPLDSLRSVVGAVNQAEKLGTPLSTILKLQSEMLRMHRGVRAEKLAASASLKILVPSMLILIAVIIVIGAPLLVSYFVTGSLF